MKKQRGGTLLGLVIGALVGLGIALTVAVYVTKVPVPFMNKSPSHTPDSDAAEARKNKDWNPNAPLAGKNPARAAPSASGELSPPAEPPTASNVPDPVLVPEEPRKPERVVKPPKTATAPATPSTPPAPAPAPTAAAKPAKPLSADPLGDLAKARSESPAFSSGASDPFNYFIQAGAYRTPEDAEQQRARLLLLGMQAKVTEREQAGRTVYRVRVGPFDKKDDADRIKDRLDNSSIETALVRVQR
ncbi:SPOR domain-containing protein [Polaromonas sp.]|uniref:SPOR domain-containing protein n=1 Tax=Polaromonas sp. TaxID=1869339 RepID=UPI0025F83A84|nr:SPOR domain-containing protein [Polaromonas sp.]